jgi:hypothetical protein
MSKGTIGIDQSAINQTPSGLREANVEGKIGTIDQTAINQTLSGVLSLGV